MKVRALNTYKELNVTDKDLNRIPEPGEEFQVSEERLNVLLGNNGFKRAFVEVVKETATIEKKEIKKPTKKYIARNE